MDTSPKVGLLFTICQSPSGEGSKGRGGKILNIGASLDAVWGNILGKVEGKLPQILTFLQRKNDRFSSFSGGGGA